MYISLRTVHTALMKIPNYNYLPCQNEATKVIYLIRNVSGRKEKRLMLVFICIKPTCMHIYIIWEETHATKVSFLIMIFL